MKLLSTFISILCLIMSHNIHAQVVEKVIYYDTATTTRLTVHSPSTKDSIFTAYNSVHYFCAQRLDSIGITFGGGGGGGAGGTVVFDTTWILYAYDGLDYTIVHDSKTNPAIKPKKCLGTKYNKLFIELASGIGYYNGSSIVPLNGISAVQEVSFLDTYMMFYSNDANTGGFYKYDGNSVSFIDSLEATFFPSVRPVVINDALYFKAIEKGAGYSFIPGYLDHLWKYDGNTLTKIDSGLVGSTNVIEKLTPYHGNLYYTLTSYDTTLNQVVLSGMFRYDGIQKQRLYLTNDSLYYGLNTVGDYLYYTTTNQSSSAQHTLYQYHDSSSSNVPIFTPTNSNTAQVANNTYYSLGPIPLMEYDNNIYYSVEEFVINNPNTFSPWEYDFTNPTSLAPIVQANYSFEGFYNLRSTVDSRSTVDAAIANGSVYFNTGNKLFSYDKVHFQPILSTRGAFVDAYQLQAVGGEIFLLSRRTGRLPTLHKLKNTITNISPLAPKQDLQVFPNPTTGLVTLQTTATVASVQILNLEGKVVLTPSVDNINISSLATGVYILQAQTSEGSMYQKVVKE